MRARWLLVPLFVTALLTACESQPSDDGSSGDGAASADAGPSEAERAARRERLSNPRLPELNEQGPDTWRAVIETSQGNAVLEIHRDWAPHGADRFWNLVKNGYYQDQRFFRVLPGFVVQWGIDGDPAIAGRWLEATLPPDEVKQSNTRGRITYAMGRTPDTRSVQLFVNYGNNANLDGMGFAPFGEVVEGMDVLEQLYSGYGEQASGYQGRIASSGNGFLDANFPELDTLVEIRVLE